MQVCTPPPHSRIIVVRVHPYVWGFLSIRAETPEADVHINYGLRDILEKLLTATAAAAPASAPSNTTHPTSPAPPIPPSSHDAPVPPRQRQQQADGQDDTDAIAPPSRT